MKNNQRRMLALMKMFKNTELFYIISIGRYTNSLQAEFNSDLVKEILSLKFTDAGTSETGYLHFRRRNIEITLT